jgi:small subunit ribosomal protein S21
MPLTQSILVDLKIIVHQKVAKYFKPKRNFDNNDPMSAKRGLYVEVRGGDVMKALRIFKKKVQEEGILQEYKERQHYEKPSAKRKKAKAAGRKRWLKTQEKLITERLY